jgi:hydroxymethylbilane synthase
VGTRNSPLALWQTEHVIGRLRELHPGLAVEVQRIRTEGDRIKDVPLAQIGGRGVFVKDIENALRAGSIDLAVHSLKDMTTVLPDGLVIGAVLAREDARDVLISPRGYRLDTLPPGARIGTSSLRRAAQLRAWRPDLRIAELRGNVGTRLRKAESEGLDTIVLAAAGVLRLGLADRIADYLPVGLVTPAVGQGALALQVRLSDEAVLQLVKPLHDGVTGAAVSAERSLLRALGGGCQVPIAALAQVREGTLHLMAMVASLDGALVLRDAMSGEIDHPEALGLALAERLKSMGAEKILASEMPVTAPVDHP